ncbi:MAG: hypothetical protein GX825_10110, partial [Syntrophomonadaceae bacterium]|nr:hypothetical protein [Syntrophomonadaceae bacterium]
MGLIGVDIGTTGCKATIFDYEGNAKSGAYKEYTLESPRAGWRELDPDEIWLSVKEVLARSIQSYTGDTIKAISISSIGEAVVPVDKSGRVLNNSIIYLDERGRKEVEYLENKMGMEKVYTITGLCIHPMYALSKIMWLKKHKTEIFKG